MNTFYLKENQHKGDWVRFHLERAGWERKRFLDFPDAFFYDVEWGNMGYGFPERFYLLDEKVKPIFIYPHTPRAGYPYTVREPWPNVAARFVFGEGTKEIYRRMGIEGAIHVVGWPYSQMWSLRQPHLKNEMGKPINVCFAPIHPNSNGFLFWADQQTNTHTHSVLCELADAGLINLTVRHLQPLPRSGILSPNPDVNYISGQPDGSVKEMKAADVVIGAYTFAYMAIASGIPTIMIGETKGHWSGAHEDMMRHHKSPELWMDFARYTHNFEDVFHKGSLAWEMIIQAQYDYEQVAQWKRLFIGTSHLNDEVFLAGVGSAMDILDHPATYLNTHGVTIKDSDGAALSRFPGSVVTPHFVPDKKEAK